MAEETQSRLGRELKTHIDRLDKVISSAGLGNGMITVANFHVVGQKVRLRGAELSKVGTGYVGTGKTMQEQAESLVDAVEKELSSLTDDQKEAMAKPSSIKPGVKAPEDEKPSEVTVAEKGSEAVTDTDDEPSSEGEEETPEEDETPEETNDETVGGDAGSEEEEKKVDLNIDEMKALLKERGVEFLARDSKETLKKLVSESDPK